MRNQNLKNTNKKNRPEFLSRRLSEGGFILVMACALFTLLSLLTYTATDPGWLHTAKNSRVIMNAGGTIGAYLADGLYLLFGYMACWFPVGVAYFAWLILKEHRQGHVFNRLVLLLRGSGLVLVLAGGCALLSLKLGYPSSGGALGNGVATIFLLALNTAGACLLLVAAVLVGITWLTGLSWIHVTEWIGFYTCFIAQYSMTYAPLLARAGLDKASALRNRRVTAAPLAQMLRQPAVVKREKKATPQLMAVEAKPLPVILESASRSQVASRVSKPVITEGLPSLSLLDAGEPLAVFPGQTPQALEAVSREVEQHLVDFGIQTDVVAVHPGPVITRFELQLAAGIKVSRLSGLARDLARSLSVTSVRVVEVIPGKTVVGLELPNAQRMMVRLSEVLSADVYQQAHSPLTLALGVDIAGHPMVVDLAKMPHLLVAGTTGSGKSVGINAMILSILFKSTPQQVRLIMIDPKMLELSVYDGIPHLLTPVVTDMKEAASALRWCVGEMERRYRLMASLGVRNLAGFNSKIAEANAQGTPIIDPLWKPVDGMLEEAPALVCLPYVVVFIDELADMMMVVGKKVEQLIARIAQKARAAGIHLILATQRPSVDVLTGLIKSNIPTRISFQVSSKIDSRTILDQQGAESLLGHGDMLYLAPGSGAPLRVHGAFVDDAEVHRIADDWRARGKPDYLDEITRIADDTEARGGEEGGGAVEEADPLYDEAVSFVIQTRKASISSVQRRFKIGYNRAARLVEEMERTGLVGSLEGGMRDVLVQTMEE